MMTSMMHLTHLVFIGSRREQAKIEFGLGLNLIYGPSNTGKSSMLDAIDFMLGREKRQLKEIPEHEGYEEILLGIKFSNGEAFTLARSLSGGSFKCYEGTHFQTPEDEEVQILRPKNKTKKEESLPNFVLGKLDLADKKLKKNKRNDKESLTLRNFLPLFLINEINIQKETPVYFGNQNTAVTAEKSRLRFLLTGVDDNALVTEEKEAVTVSRQARLQLLAEFIDDNESQIARLGKGEDIRGELRDQQLRLENTLARERDILSSSETVYREIATNRNTLRRQLIESEDRLAEMEEMLSRFVLLKEQYSTDIRRLDSITEAGTLFVALSSTRCPVCGANPEDHDGKGECESQTSDIVAAADAERRKIEALQTELDDVISTLRTEAQNIEADIPSVQSNLSEAEQKLSSISPKVMEQRSKYTEFLDKKSEVEQSMLLFEDLEKLEKKRKEIEEENRVDLTDDESSSNLPTKALETLAKHIRDFLEQWGLANSSTVHFEKENNDFVIGGKLRASNGKGLRAITHAAATLGLLKFTEEKELPYPGFVILDSPLLAYEKPEDKDDDLSDTDVNLKFFNSLASWSSRQIIVFENKKSVPDKYESGSQITHFTKSQLKGRYGFFPSD